MLTSDFIMGCIAVLTLMAASFFAGIVVGSNPITVGKIRRWFGEDKK